LKKGEVIKENMLEKNIDIFKNLYYKIDSWSISISRNKRSNSIVWIMSILVCFLAVFFLNLLTPFISDDFAYLFVYGEDTRVQTIGDAFRSQVNHYNMWGGRSVVHFIAQVLLLLPYWVADLLNSIMYMAYVFLIYLHINGNKKNSLGLFLLINLAIWFFQPVIGDTLFWITGSANYLWGTCFILLFLLPYRLYNGKVTGRLKLAFFSVSMLVMGLIAGWTNENTAGAMILLTILFLFYYRKEGWETPLWAYTGLLSSIIGFVIMIAAPGNFVRAGEAGSLSLYVMAYRLFNTTFTFVYYCIPPLFASVIAIIVFRHYRKDGQAKDINYYSLLYFIAAFAAIYAMLLSPTFPRRALFGVVTFMIIGSGIYVYNLDYSKAFVRQLRFSILVAGLVCFLFTYYWAVKEITAYRDIISNREVILDEAHAKGISEIEFESYSGGKYIHGEDPFSADLMSKYYGVTIKMKE